MQSVPRHVVVHMNPKQLKVQPVVVCESFSNCRELPPVESEVSDASLEFSHVQRDLRYTKRYGFRKWAGAALFADTDNGVIEKGFESIQPPAAAGVLAKPFTLDSGVDWTFQEVWSSLLR